MGLLERIFKPPRDSDGAASLPASSGYTDSDPPAEGARAPRRELLQVVLRDTMRSHGIPSDWIDCRIFPARSRTGRGVQVHFVVRKSHEQMLPYLLAFQQSFEAGLHAFDPHAGDWLLGLAWQFEGAAPVARSAAPPAGAAAPAATASAAEPDLQEDLQALFAIRDQALAQAGSGGDESRSAEPGFEPTRPGDYGER